MRPVNLEVVPIKGSTAKDRSYLVLFEVAASGTARFARMRGPCSPRGQWRMHETRRTARSRTWPEELAATREYLPSVIEQQEAANEELAVRERGGPVDQRELQSINEELETSREEIQSSNEELTTVNEELHERNVELNRATTT
jgi:two-component system CheB/CheR fusion protein